MFEEAIIKNNLEQIAKLWGPAGKAYESPDTGIEVLKKGAYFVIRDCAKVARMCLPIYVWELYDDPITSLKGKFTKVDVKDFLKRSESDPEASALKKVILNDIKVKHQVAEPAPSQPQSISFEESGDDLYGYYEGYDDTEEENSHVEVSAESLSDDDLFRKYLL
jgi:hypothetical protein